VLVTAAHPDDEIGCAGTINRLTRQGSEVDILTFSRCIDVEGVDPDDLEHEWRTAADLLGIRGRYIGDIPNRLFPSYRQAVLSTLDGYAPASYDLVLTPASFDLHQDHLSVSQEVARVFKRTTILGYELPLNSVFETRHAAYVPLDEEDLDAKVRHVMTYVTQRDRPYMSPTYIGSLARVRGMQAGVGAAEAFEVIRWIVR
jgi:LmbE family N-acetylglucosaminyl deacetylase